MIPRSPRLPSETCDHILDCLWDDRGTLIACSRTCRAWLPRCRFHLFRTVTLKNTPGYKGFERLLKKSPNVAPYVCEVTIIKTNQRTRACEVDREWPRILLKLNRVERLTLIGTPISSVSDETRQKFATSFPMVKTLCLTALMIQQIDFQLLLCACPNLSALHLSSAVIVCRNDYEKSLDTLYTSAVASSVSSRPIRIDTLTWLQLDETGLPWLLNGPIGLRLRRLNLGGLDSHSMMGVQSGMAQTAILQGAGTTLEHLVFSFCRDYFTDEWKNEWSLAYNTRLASIHIKEVFWQSFVHSPERIQPRRCEGLLSLVNSSHVHLERIQFSMKLARLTYSAPWALWDASHWNPVDSILSRLSRERSQLKVIFAMHDSENMGEEYAQAMVDTIVARLPMLLAGKHQLGILHGRYWDDDLEFGGGLSHPRREHWFESS